MPDLHPSPDPARDTGHDRDAERTRNPAPTRDRDRDAEPTRDAAPTGDGDLDHDHAPIRDGDLDPAPTRIRDLDLRARRYDDPDATALIAAVQAEYVLLYGTPDESRVDPAEFAEPEGAFFVGYLRDDRDAGDVGEARAAGDIPVAMGGWRRHGHERADTAWAHPAAEIKRMYVAPTARGRGFARAVLAAVERSAAASGCRWLVLETGMMQPEAVALYRSSGYDDVPHFGHYADSPEAVHLGKRIG